MRLNLTQLAGTLAITACLFVYGFGTQTDSKQPPIELVGVVDALKHSALTKEELINTIKSRGVTFRLSPQDENQIRVAGKYLGKVGIEELLKNIRLSYRPTEVDEELTLLLGTPAVIDYLQFFATFKEKAGDDYVVTLKYPGTESMGLRVHTGCEYLIKVGNGQYTFSVTDTQVDKIRVKLTSRLNKRIEPVKTGFLAPDESPETLIMRVAPCITLSFHLVVGNHTEYRGLPITPYYISDPLPWSVLRLYITKNSSQTTIPPQAKDTDPISSIYSDDANGIAKMIGGELPSDVQWINAFHGQKIKMTSKNELVKSDSRDYLAVVSDEPASHNTYLSSRISFYFYPETSSHGPPQGHIRIVLPISAGMPKSPEEK